MGNVKIVKHGKVVITEEKVRAEDFVIAAIKDPRDITAYTERMVAEWAIKRLRKNLFEINDRIKEIEAGEEENA